MIWRGALAAQSFGIKEDLWAHARETKDALLADLKARAAANPLALAAVATGVGWRLFLKPFKC
jgi:hypothetical protein